MTWQNHCVVTRESRTMLEAYSMSTDGNAEERWRPLSGTGYYMHAYDPPVYVYLPTAGWSSLRFGFWIQFVGGATYSFTSLRNRVFYLVNATQVCFNCVIDFGISMMLGWSDTGTYAPMPQYDQIPLSQTPLLRELEWHHVGVILTPTLASLYIDGNLTLQADTPQYNLGGATPLERLAISGANPEIRGTGVDDFYLDYSTDTEAHVAPMPYRFHPTRLQRTGDYNEWEAVSPTQVPGDIFNGLSDSPTTNYYYQSNTTGERQTFRLGPPNIPLAHQVAGVGAQIYSDQDERGLELATELDGNIAYSDLQNPVRSTTGYAAPGSFHALDPLGNSWTLDKMARVGVGVRSK